MAAIAVDRLRKAYGGTVAVAGVDFRVRDGEWFVVAGPRGSGKTTLLRLIAGEDEPGGGRVVIDDRDVTSEPPGRRDLRVVRAPDSRGRQARARAVLPSGIRRFFSSAAPPASALAQLKAALCDSAGRSPRPAAVLADDPFAGLEPAARAAARAEAQALHQRVGGTVLHATSDDGDALALGHRMAVLIGGLIEQVGPPVLLYERPATVGVAAFVGAPSMNLVAGRVAIERGRPVFRASGRVLTTLPPSAGVLDGRPMTLGVRPPDVVLSANGEGLTGSVDAVQPSGPAQVLQLTLADGWPFAAVVPARPLLAPGVVRRFVLRTDRLHLFGPDGRRFVGADAPPA